MPFDDEFAIKIGEEFQNADPQLRELRPRLPLVTCRLSLAG